MLTRRTLFNLGRAALPGTACGSPDRLFATASEAPQVSRACAVVLWLLLALFVCRVVGQALVAFFNVTSLPPMAAWQSSLIDYPWLLGSQLVIVVVYAKVCLDCSRGRGVAVVPRRRLGQGLLAFGGLYLLATTTRYAVVWSSTARNAGPAARSRPSSIGCLRASSWSSAPTIGGACRGKSG
jgi:hypothetical protein